MLPTERKAQILHAAIGLATNPGGWQSLTREAVASAADCSVGLVSLYHGDIEHFRQHIMRVAVRDRLLPIIAQGLAAGNRVAHRAPDELKAAALNSLLSR